MSSPPAAVRRSIRRPLSRRTALAGIAALGVALAGCGASPTDTGGPGGGGGADIQSVYAAVAGLTGQQRFDKLLELAKEEGGEVSIYHATDLKPVVEGFEQKTGLHVNDFKATSERVAERLSHEASAGRAGSDIFLVSVEDVPGLRAAGAIAPLDTPALDTVTDEFKADGVVSPLVILLMPSYNTDSVTPADLPRTWEDLFTNFPGRIGIELTDWQWYETLVTKYFVDQKGMTEDQAIALVTDGLKGARTVDGHSLLATLLVSGEFTYAPTQYAQYTASNAATGGPVSYDGLSPDMPPIATGPLPLGLSAGSSHPASGLLFLEYMMSEEGQEVIADMNYVPTASTYPGETLLEKYPNTIFMQEVSSVEPPEQRQKWQANFDVLLRSIGGQVATSGS